jgi:hypothetical protein
MKKQTIAYHEASHAVVARRLGYPVDGASIVSKEASEGRVKLPNPMRRKDAELDRHRIWVEHAAIIALAGPLTQKAPQSTLEWARRRVGLPEGPMNNPHQS